MYIDTTFPPPDPRLAQVMRVFEALDRDTLAAVIDRGIERLDAIDGDADEEDDDRGAVLMIADGMDATFDEDFPLLDGLAGSPEDAEDDDPAGGEITDEPHDPEEDFGADDRGEGGSWPEDIAPSLTVAYGDDEHEQDSPRILAEFRDRIRRKRCRLDRYGPRHMGWGRYVIDGPTPPCLIGRQA